MASPDVRVPIAHTMWRACSGRALQDLVPGQDSSSRLHLRTQQMEQRAAERKLKAGDFYEPGL